jgi:hypothetical protein
MAGSKREFLYETDSGVAFAVVLDESNVEFVNTADTDVPPAGTIVLPVAKYLRKIRYVSANGLYSVDVPILTLANITTAPADFDASFTEGDGTNVTVNLRKRKSYAESFLASRGGDTGLNDGDIP